MIKRKIIIRDEELTFPTHESNTLSECLGIDKDKLEEFANNLNDDLREIAISNNGKRRSEFMEKLDKNFSRAELLLICEQFINQKFKEEKNIYKMENLEKEEIELEKDKTLFKTMLKDILKN